MNDRQQLLSRALAFSLFLTLVEYSKIFRIAFGPLLGVDSSALALLTSWTWLLLLGIAVAGLTSTRRWGAYALAALVPVSTMLMAIPLIPAVSKLIPVSLRPEALATLNILVLVSVPLLLYRPARASVAAPQANEEL